MSEPLITGNVVGTQSVVAHLEGADARVTLALRQQVQLLTEELYGHVRDEFLSGRALKVRSGHAHDAVRKTVRTGRYSITGSVFANVSGDSKDTPFYLKFWESGFTRKTKKARKDGAVVGDPREIREEAARPSFRPALDEMSVRIVERLGPLAAEVI